MKVRPASRRVRSVSKYPGRTICQSTAWSPVVGERLLGAPADGAEATGERKRERRGDALHAGNRAQPFFDLFGQLGTLRRRPRAAAEELERQQAARIESRIDALQFEKTSEHQPRPDEQHEAQRHFGDHHCIPEPAAGAETGGAAAAAKHGHGIHAERAPCGHHPEEHGHHQRDRRGESQHGRVDADSVEPRQIRRGDRAQLANANPGKRDAGARAERGEHERVGQHLTDDAPAAGSERGAHREFPFTDPRPDQQQVRDVGAGDQQEKNDGARQRENRRPDLCDQGVVHRLQPRVEPGGGLQRKVLPKLRRDRFHRFLRPCQRHARLQPGIGRRPKVLRFALS